MYFVQGNIIIQFSRSPTAFIKDRYEINAKGRVEKEKKKLREKDKREKN